MCGYHEENGLLDKMQDMIDDGIVNVVYKVAEAKLL